MGKLVAIETSDMLIYSLEVSYVVSSEGIPRIVLRSEGEIDAITVVGILELVKQDLMVTEGK
jgi:hypothetical protein